MEKFSPSDFESKWQKVWEKSGIYQPDLHGAKRPFYNLMMFPYPSAEGLHVGNMYAFTGVDIFGRFKRMQGYDVFEPIGLDGFGIHSENYALKIGKHPKEQAKISEANFYRQLGAIGNGFAWNNRLETYDPDYYKWTQWIFVQMFKHGLAYRKKSHVNFCPSCKTVLSDEQVIKKLKSQNSNLKSDQLDELDQSVCERCGTRVTKKEMEQWFFKITDYAERLLQNTYRKDFNWTEKVKIGQRNWIGKKEGINITYDIDGTSEKVTVFTTAPVNFGMTFLVLGPEHQLSNKIIKGEVKVPQENKDAVGEYVKQAKKKGELERIAEGKEKTGVFTGLYAINGINGKKVPVWVTDFVLGHVGTGAVQGCPGHDRKDFQFAKKFGLPIIRVIVGPDGDMSVIDREMQVIEKGMKGHFVNSEFLNGLEFEEGLQKTMDYFVEKGWGKRVTTYKLRDWCISRQRYWGAPIPMINCPKCKWVPVPDDQLPVLLPDLKDWKPEGTGKGPLAKLKDWVKVKCPQCGGGAERETDVCDTFLDSSWYFLRYPSIGLDTLDLLAGGARSGSPKSGVPAVGDFGAVERQDPQIRIKELPWDPQITRNWLPVHSYIGGAEHTVLHLLYSRFVTMAFHDWGLLNFDEPYKRFYAHGLIIAEGAKMSKSRGNVIIPDEYIRKYGADTLRAYLMFLGPFDAGGDFRDTGIAGMYRFLGRVWRLVTSFIDAGDARSGSPKSVRPRAEGDFGAVERQDPRIIMHKTIKEVTEDLENLRYNTAIAHIMEYINEISNLPGLARHGAGKSQISNLPGEAIKTLLLLLAPFVPHMTEELWERIMSEDLRFTNKNENKRRNSHKSYLINHKSIHLHPWPSFNPKYLVESEVTIVVQVNGKTRDVIKVAASHLMEETVTKLAQKSEKVAKHLAGQKIRKTIFVPGKLINFVI